MSQKGRNLSSWFATTPDVPSKPDDVNQEGREVPADLPRVPFYHWLLWKISPAVREIVEGSHSNGVVPRGKNENSPTGYVPAEAAETP